MLDYKISYERLSGKKTTSEFIMKNLICKESDAIKISIDCYYLPNLKKFKQKEVFEEEKPSSRK